MVIALVCLRAFSYFFQMVSPTDLAEIGCRSAGASECV